MDNHKIKKVKTILVILILLILLVSLILYVLYRESKVAVLCYHNIATQTEKDNFPEEQRWTIDVNNFKEQMEYLYKNNYKTLTLDEFYQWKQGNIKIPFKSVLITFDDGFLSNYEYAFPILKQYNINATVFVIGSYIENGKQTWQGSLHDYMSKEIIEKCKTEYPNITFASHTYNLHEKDVIYSASKETIEKDIKTFNSNILEAWYMCYPYGEYTNEFIDELKNNKFKLAFIYGPTKENYRKASREDDNYKIPRLNISSGMNIKKFALRLIYYK